jgi:hypothetical protein
MNFKELSPKVTPNKLNKIMESRFGFAIDFDNLSVKKARALSAKITEGMNRMRKTHDYHLLEKNSKYMELLMINESLTRWVDSKVLTEGEMGKSEVLLASKDLVDSIQDMLEKASKMQVEQLPALLDAVRDQIGHEQAEQFKGSVSGIITDLVSNLTNARDQLDTSARTLAGEQVNQDMAMPGDAGQEELGDLGAELPDQDLEDLEEPEFSANDAAAGGEEELGRGLR